MFLLGFDFSKHSIPLEEILSGGPRSFTDLIGSEKVRVEYDPPSRTARIRDRDGRDIPAVVAYWFAWAAFHPETEIYIAFSLKDRSQ